MRDAVRTNGHGLPVVSLDIDNTLGDWHSHFLSFAENWIGKPMPDAKEINPGLPLYKFMRITRPTYRECKLAFRQGGYKRWMPAYPGASDLTRNIYRAGAEVYICTTRPFLRLENLDPDTREWLRRNGIKYSGVIFDPLHMRYGKYHELRRQVGDRVCSIADDLPKMLVKAQAIGYPRESLYMRLQPYNHDYSQSFQTFDSLDYLWERIKQDIYQWKGKA